MSPRVNVEPPARSERVQLTLDRLKACTEFYHDQLRREDEDLSFQTAEGQWPPEIANLKKAQNVLGVDIPAQPMLTVSTIDEPITLVENQFRAAHLGVTITPLTEDADEATAEVFQGIYRQIEQTSRAAQARLWAFRRGLRAGRGAYEVTKEYDPDSPVKGDQRLMIRRILHQESTYFDPDAELADWSDEEYAIKVSAFTPAKLKRRWPKSKLASYNDDQLSGLSSALDDAGYKGWITGTDAKTRRVLVAQHFYYEYGTETTTGVDWKGNQVTVESETRQAWYCFTNGIEELGEPVQCDGPEIPLIPTIAEELIPFNDHSGRSERRWCGMTYRAKDGARLTNYAASNAVKMAALEPLAPFEWDPRQIEKFEQFWKRSNTVAFPGLPYNSVIDGVVVPPPQRVQADMSRIGPSMQLLTLGEQFVKSATFTFDPALGKQPTAHRSGRAIVSLQDQTQLGTSGYLDTFTQVSMLREAHTIVGAIPHVYDRPGRVQQILDPSGKTRYVMLNAPFVMNERTGQPEPLPYETDEQKAATDKLVADPDHPAKFYNLSKGRYAVSVTIGKSYATQQQEGATEMGEILQAVPAMLPVIGPEYFRYRGEPWAQQVAKLLEKERDHSMPWLSDKKPDADPNALAAENAALKQQLQQAAQIIQAKAVEKQADQESKLKVTAIQESAENERNRQDNETKITVAAIAGFAKEMADFRAFMAQQIERLGSQQHESAEAAAAREHEAALTASGQAHDAALGAQGHAQSLEQQQQAAALQPTPEGGSTQVDGEG